MSKEEPTIEDLEEDLNLDDFEEFEEEGSSEIDVSGIEYKVFPLNKEFLSKIPDNIDPKKVISEESLFLYNPLSNGSSFVPIKGNQIKFENIQNRLIVKRPNRRFLQSGNKDFAKLTKQLKSNVGSFLDNMAKVYPKTPKSGKKQIQKPKNNN